jgi:hypothetical protein
MLCKFLTPINVRSNYPDGSHNAMCINELSLNGELMPTCHKMACNLEHTQPSVTRPLVLPSCCCLTTLSLPRPNYVCDRRSNKYGSAGRIIGRETRSTRRICILQTFCPPQIAHDLIWVRTKAAEYTKLDFLISTVDFRNTDICIHKSVVFVVMPCTVVTGDILEDATASI